MEFRIKKGKHRALPFYWSGWWPILHDPIQVARRVCFSVSTRYDLKDQDQDDRNKLFGLCFGKVKDLSARFAWRYDIAREVFILSAYCHLNGAMIMFDLCDAVLNKWYDCHIVITDIQYIFRVMDEDGKILCTHEVSKGHRKKWALLLGPFFGGNEAAPDNLSLQLKKIKSTKTKRVV